jgi:hypothetical protein
MFCGTQYGNVTELLVNSVVIGVTFEVIVPTSFNVYGMVYD